MNSPVRRNDLKPDPYKRHVATARSLGLTPLSQEQFEEAQTAHTQLSSMSGPELAKVVDEIGRRHGAPESFKK